MCGLEDGKVNLGIRDRFIEVLLGELDVLRKEVGFLIRQRNAEYEERDDDDDEEEEECEEECDCFDCQYSSMKAQRAREEADECEDVSTCHDCSHAMGELDRAQEACRKERAAYEAVLRQMDLMRHDYEESLQDAKERAKEWRKEAKKHRKLLDSHDIEYKKSNLV